VKGRGIHTRTELRKETFNLYTYGKGQPKRLGDLSIVLKDGRCVKKPLIYINKTRDSRKGLGGIET